MSNLISVIMPVYNSSKYLEESIESVINQKYRNWELICIDDGSTDDSFEILKGYEKKYKAVKVYKQENLGPAQARKLGISKSKGDYISYLDSDDVYSENYLEETLHQSLAHDADVTMPIMIANWHSEDKYNFNLLNDLKFGEVIQPKIAFLRTFPWTVHGCNLYKASHIKKYALTDISNINNFNSDEYLTRYLLLFSKKIVVSKGKYYYRSNKYSITKSFSTRQFSSLKVDKLLFQLALSEKFCEKDISTIAEHLFLNKIHLKKLYLDNILNIKKEDRKNINADLSDVYEKYFLNFNSTRKKKRYLFLKINSNVFLFFPILRKILKSA